MSRTQLQFDCQDQDDPKSIILNYGIAVFNIVILYMTISWVGIMIGEVNEELMDKVLITSTILMFCAHVLVTWMSSLDFAAAVNFEPRVFFWLSSIFATVIAWILFLGWWLPILDPSILV